MKETAAKHCARNGVVHLHRLQRHEHGPRLSRAEIDLDEFAFRLEVFRSTIAAAWAEDLRRVRAAIRRIIAK